MSKAAWLAAGLLIAACGDNVQQNPDAPPVMPDAPPDTPPDPFVKPTPFPIPLAAAGPDQLQTAAAAPDGKFYGAGFAAQTVTGARLVTIVKYDESGLDTTFAANGVLTTAVDFKGGNGQIQMTLQPDGKIIVAATVASATDAADRDIAVMRVLPTGTLDATFGAAGIATVNFNDGILVNGTLTGTDLVHGITADANGIYLHGASRGLGNNTAGSPRTDTDFTVVRLTEAGVVDPTFAATATVPGQFRLDIQESGANPRGIKALPDGSLIVSGYANSPGVGSTQPVLFKLTSAGALDNTFPLFHEAVLATQTEIYNIVIHGNSIITGGYGRNSGATNDYVSLKFDVATGVRDTAWGGAPNGAVVFDPSGAMLGSNCRNAIALPDGKTLLAGSTGPGNMPAQDAVFAILDATGKLDTEYLTGVHVFKLGADGNDQFWGTAVSGNKVTVIGYKGGGPAASQTDTNNDDSFAAVFELR